jgi:hypothetical protein
MKNSDKEKIKNAVDAFVKNFGSVTIEDADYGGGYYVHQIADFGAIHYCPTIDNLEGWLWGCVQTKNGIVKKV